jgi:hypothetical protein
MGSGEVLWRTGFETRRWIVGQLLDSLDGLARIEERQRGKNPERDDIMIDEAAECAQLLDLGTEQPRRQDTIIASDHHCQLGGDFGLMKPVAGVEPGFAERERSCQEFGKALRRDFLDNRQQDAGDSGVSVQRRGSSTLG